jgi:transposase InsO family protein
VQDELVCAFDRIHREHGVTAREFCAALALPERTFRSWQDRPAKPAAPPPPKPPSPPPNDRNTGRFALEATAPDTQLGGDTTDLCVLSVDLKLVGIQDIGDRERCLFDAFAIDERESSDLITATVTAAAAGREGLQFITDQGTPYLAQAAQQAYDAIGLEHAPQREGTPTEKATVERGFGTLKNALAPIFDVLNRIAAAVPELRRPVLARHVATLLVATYLRVYAVGRCHLRHPLDGQDPDVLRAVVEEQRERARAEDRSVRLFLEAIHAEYAMDGSCEAFVRAFRRYPLEDLRDAERRFRAHACRCKVRVCDRYFAAVVRDVHEAGVARRSAERRQRRSENQARRARANAAQRAADLDAHPERRLHEGLDLLADTWLPHTGGFVYDGQLARIWIRRAIAAIREPEREPIAAADCIEVHVRSWQAARPNVPAALCEAVRGVLRELITEVRRAADAQSPAALLGGILASSTRTTHDNERPPSSPHLRI